MIEGIGYFVFGVLSNMLDPVKWIVISIPIVLLIKTVKAATTVQHWYNEHLYVLMGSVALGTVLSILYSSEAWIFCFFSSNFIAVIVLWLRSQWLRKKEKSKGVTPGGSRTKQKTKTQKTTNVASHHTGAISQEEVSRDREEAHAASEEAYGIGDPRVIPSASNQVHRDRGNKDEELYKIAWRELEEGVDEGLWARLLAEHDGDEEKTTADYLKTRVERLNSSMLTKVVVPNIDDFSDVDVIEVLVKPGSRVNTESPMITLECDKATMDVPSPIEGIVSEVVVKVGDKVSKGSLLAWVYKNV